MNVLITSIGKRVQLIKHLKQEHYIIGVDCNDLVSSKEFVDVFYKVPRYNEKSFIKTILDICKNEKVDLLIPLYEKEFFDLCDNRKKFEEFGTTLLLSSKSIIDICNNKLNTYEFFKKSNISTPVSYSKSDIGNILYNNNKKKELKFPLIIKPIDGMGSNDVFKINNEKELSFFKEYVDNPIIQEFIDGKEYTIDVLCDLFGNVISVVPRERIEVRSGEVVKSKTVKNKEIIDSVMNLCDKLKKASNDNSISIVGPLTIQCIYTSNKVIKFIEINPRFGGGVPLTFESGVNYGKIFNELKNNNFNIKKLHEFKETLMLRYDEAVFK
ncbi:ATP-grasp domain-containing protein [Clostridium botulinum]|nr:ATP-grasp domain-containing protein [Clostridium botulinum]